MKIVIAPDSFKESLTALEVADAIEIGFKKILPQAEYIKVPMADGGEGTVQSLIDATGGRRIDVDVTAPLGNKIRSFFGILGDDKTAVIEMAAASGLHLVPLEQRNPLNTTSFGTGELINAALNLGVNHIILGIGGSATNDGGAGMLQALGAKLLDANQQQIPLGGEALLQLTHIDLANINPRLSHIQLDVACDVTNPLCGELGASAIFAPQKGATPAMVQTLDRALSHFAYIIKQDLALNIRDQAGAGAAGGMGGGLFILPNVQLKSGVKIVIDALNLAKIVQQADLIITGEGQMDGQSIYGKTPIGVAQLAKQFDKPVIAIVGSLKKGYSAVYENGIDSVFPIIPHLGSLEDTLKCGRENLISTAQNIAKLYCIAHSMYGTY